MTAALHRLVGRLRRCCAAAEGPTDRQLLERFAARRDEAAFAELVRRHGPLVRGAARRVLGCPHDAEDVFQATFLVLARRASAVRWRESVGGWLFPVAYHLALKVRAGRRRRNVHESQAGSQTAAERHAPPEDGLRAVIDEELDRLPAHYREVVILCYLEGHSRHEAAARLGLTANEVRGRLERARQRLRDRLTRRGLALSAVGVAALAGRGAWAGTQPAAMIARAAGSFATGPAAAGRAAGASPRAVALARGVLNAMLFTKCKTLLLIAAAAAVLGAAALLLPPAAAGGDANSHAAALADKVLRPRPAAAREPKPEPPRKARSCIILWMGGGPSTIDLFDMKPGNANGGPFKEIETATKGLRISEHLPHLAKLTESLAFLRSVNHTEGDHARSTHLMRTGRSIDGGEAPPLPSALAKELSGGKLDVPPYVVVNPLSREGPGFLPPQFGPLAVPIRDGREPPKPPPAEAFEKLSKEKAEAMRKGVEKAFAVGDEKDATRDAYGRTPFGQGCLLARRLVEAGVPVVEVDRGGWDTHANNFDAVKALCEDVDPAWAALMSDLKDRGLLDGTLVVWMGEFGRTPRINANGGRDHYPRAFTVVLGGCGIKGGVVVGKTSEDGSVVEERPVTPAELHATIYKALGVDPTTTNKPEGGDPLPLVEKGTAPVKEVLK